MDASVQWNESTRTISIKQSDTKSFTGQRAIQIAKNYYGKDDDIGYSYDMDMAYEYGKPYYTIFLYSISMREQGGSGALLSAKVFTDGTIIEN